MTANLYSHQAWLTYSQAKAAELPSSAKLSPSSLRSTMLAISKTALDSRARELRVSDSDINKKLKTAIAGFIPLLKIGVSFSACNEFADKALQAFGSSDATGLRDIARQLKRSTSGKEDLSMDILSAVGEVLRKLSFHDLVVDTTANTLSEAIHLKPFVGQMVSAGTGYVTVRKGLLGVIDKVQALAVEVHRDFLIPIVVEEVQ